MGILWKDIDTNWQRVETQLRHLQWILDTALPGELGIIGENMCAQCLKCCQKCAKYSKKFPLASSIADVKFFMSNL